MDRPLLSIKRKKCRAEARTTPVKCADRFQLHTDIMMNDLLSPYSLVEQQGMFLWCGVSMLNNMESGSFNYVFSSLAAG